MLRQYINFTLIWPILQLVYQSGLDQIFPEIKPLLMITFPAAQLPVKKIALPDRLFRRIRPAASRIRTPKLNPSF